MLDKSPDKWGFVVGRIPETRCIPPTSVRVIVLITIIFALIAITLAVITLTWQSHVAAVAAALSAVVATVTLSERAIHRLTQWQRPSAA